jgi:hypothetical protein
MGSGVGMPGQGPMRTPVAAGPAVPAFPELERLYPGIGVALSVLRLVWKPLLFVAVLLFVGVGLGKLIRNVVVPPPLDAVRELQRDPKVPRRLAVGSLIAWTVAGAVALESVGIHLLGTLLGGLVGALTSLLVVGAILAAVAVLAYSFSPQGRETVLGLVGWYYITRDPQGLLRNRDVDLGGGRVGRVETVAPLQTTFAMADGTREVRSNAWLLREFYRVGQSAP